MSFIHSRPIVDFGNFHQRTVAEFSPSDTPDREPDFVSPAGSVYWDAGIGVYRSSDHWAGMNGCTGQASCRWSILDAVRPGFWVTGYCGYDKFRPVSTARPAPVYGECDRALALALQSHGFVMADRSRFPAPVPSWARLSLRGSAHTWPESLPLFDADPSLRRVVSASRKAALDVLKKFHPEEEVQKIIY